MMAGTQQAALSCVSVQGLENDRRDGPDPRRTVLAGGGSYSPRHGPWKDVTLVIRLTLRPVGIVPGSSLINVTQDGGGAAGSAERGGDLYSCNGRLSGAMREELGMFEVVLRNALDRQLVKYHQVALNGRRGID